MIYMLNLTFDTQDADSDDSGFEEYNPNVYPILQSKVWLQPNKSSPDPGSPLDWTLLSVPTAAVDSGQNYMGRGFPLPLLKNDEVWIRVLGQNITSGYVARLTTTVTRDSGKAPLNAGLPYQTRRSPFPLTANQSTQDQSCVVFSWDSYMAPTMIPTTDPNAPICGYWLQQLGAVTFTTTPPPPPPNSSDWYHVIVAMIAGQGTPGPTPPASVIMCSHDPEMEVQC
jgi:hypothetical protein